MELAHSISSLRGMGPKTAEIFNTHGIHSIEDLLYFFPRAWINASEITPINELRAGKGALIRAAVVVAKEGMSQRTRIPYLRATVTDTTGPIDVMWFHARYLKPKIKPGVQFLLYGKLQGFRTQERIMMSPKFISEPCIIPVYPTIGGLPSSKTVSLFEQIKPLTATIHDYLPDDFRTQYNLISLGEAIRRMHFPQTITEINEARLRLGFDEILMLMVPSLMARLERDKELAESLGESSRAVSDWCQALPFPLTDDQQTVVTEILTDLATPKPMNRLIQGDVGTGKTVVGLAATLQALIAGKQVAWLAPTELLAAQHFATAKKMLFAHSPKALPHLAIGLWTRTHHMRATEAGESKAPLEEVISCPIVIGTHALLSEKVQFHNLGLLIIDEQHRFGVKQRSQLRLFGGKPVHLLSMTATPIPRTMALLLYGDLQLSTIKQKPAGRKPIVTKVVDEINRSKAWQFVDEQIAKGGQVYVVCPNIEPAKDDEANVFIQLFEEVEEKKAVMTWVETLKKQFPHRRVTPLHGKLKAKEKEAVMDSFRSGEIDILVSTTVIEVGVDVPNASIMMIEAADRFGLAQLHQLRGRVGRGERQSFCLLFPSSDSAGRERLQMMEQTSDGFVLAEKDLELRGPGEMTGLAQSGIPPLRFASLKDRERIMEIQRIAQDLITNDSFKQSVERFWRAHHPE